MFKIGDVVYCVDRQYTVVNKNSSLLHYLEEDIPYIIINYEKTKSGNIYKINTRSTYFNASRFISEAEYIKMNRIKKLLKIEKNVQKRNKSQI